MEISDNLIYEKKVLIRSEQVDMSRHLRMSELFRLLEEASIAHTEELGCTKDKTLDRGLLWIITRQLVEIDAMPAYDDEIIVRSWQGDMQHVFFPRFYEIEREDRVIIRGQALWMLIEETTRSMVMPEDYDIFIPGRPGAGDMMLPAVTIPKADTPSSRVISIPMKTRFSQVDINGHMNNTRYFDMIDDALHAQTDNGCIASSFVDRTDKAASPAKTASGSDAASPSKNDYLPVAVREHRIPKAVLANYLSELRLGDEFTLNIYAEGCHADPGAKTASAIDQPASAIDSADAAPKATSRTLYFEGRAGKPYFRIRYEY